MSAPNRVCYLVSIICLSLLVSCSSSKNPRPSPQVDKAWNALKSPSKQKLVQADGPIPPLTAPWWTLFEDARLNSLIEATLANNNDLKIAKSRILEAEANERNTASAFFPQFNATGVLSRQRVDSSLGRNADNIRQAGISGVWEIDVFGGNRQRDKAAAADAAAIEAEMRRVRIILVTDVARNYIQLRSLQQQYNLVEKNLKIQRRTVDATEAQHMGGVTTYLEVVRARGQANSTAARLPQINNAIDITINRLSVLTGEPASKLDGQLSLAGAIPEVPLALVVATPIDGVMRRPDVQEAEQQLIAATALSKAAFAQFFPKLTLEGFFGAQRSDLYGYASPWSMTLNGLLPLLNFGKIRSQVDAADARQEQAYVNYQQIVLLAVEEIENSLSAYRYELDRMELLRTAASEQQKAAEIARVQYESGVTSQLDLIVAEYNQLTAETDLATSQSAVASNLVILYRALGEDIMDFPANNAEPKTKH